MSPTTLVVRNVVRNVVLNRAKRGKRTRKEKELLPQQEGFTGHTSGAHIRVARPLTVIKDTHFSSKKAKTRSGLKSQIGEVSQISIGALHACYVTFCLKGQYCQWHSLYSSLNYQSKSNNLASDDLSPICVVSCVKA